MCGIAGIVRWDGRPVFDHEVRAMCGAMVHRGPDDEGIYVGDGVGIGMRRLSIIDLDTGHQPISNEDGSIWIVFNGEIYNYRDLRRQLERRGHTLRTAGDTETIVHLYEEFGTRCVDHLRGMFAFAIWDGRRRQLLLARDRLGIKPLYYAHRDHQLLFASEVKPLLQLADVERSVSWEALGHLFTFLATPADQSIVTGISKLEPARTALARPGRPLAIERYWDVSFEPDETSTEATLVERLRELLSEAVTLHQVSDVPVGAFLSGGIDSSAVVAIMAGPPASRAGSGHAGRLKTFSIGFAESDFDELAHARAVAARFGTDHHDLVLRPDVVHVVEDLTWYLDEPFGDTSAIPTYMVSKLASEHVKVVLSGDGGDELFAGYDKYLVEARERMYDRLPLPIRKLAGAAGAMMPHGMRGRRFLRHLALDGATRYLDASSLFHADEIDRLFRGEALEQILRNDPWADALGMAPAGAGLWPATATRTESAVCARGVRSDGGRAGGDWLATLQYRDLQRYLPLDILTKVDRMTMAHSIEARPPLLDHRLVEFAATVPARFRLRGTTTKYLFKRAMRGLLPDAIIDRPKHGFAVPLSHWFRGELAAFTHDILLSDTCRQRGIFSPRYITRLLELNERGRSLDLQLWTLLSFELWCRRFLDSSPRRATEAPRHGVPSRAHLRVSESPWPVAVKAASN